MHIIKGLLLPQFIQMKSIFKTYLWDLQHIFPKGPSIARVYSSVNDLHKLLARSGEYHQRTLLTRFTQTSVTFGGCQRGILNISLKASYCLSLLGRR